MKRRGRSPEAWVLAFDIGTSSLRTALFSTAGERWVESTAQSAYPLHTTADGGAELPTRTLKSAATQCLRQTLELYRRTPAARRPPILAVGGACFWHSLVGLDQRGRPVTPILTWADSRCREDAARLRERFRERDVHRRTGCMLRASFWSAKLLWLRRTQPQVFKQVRRWMSPGEWLWREFAGEAATCGLSMASGTGLLDAQSLTWDPTMLTRCGITTQRLLPISDDAQTPTARRLAGFPELRQARWFPMLGDGAASNLGCGATRPGRAAINVGTSAAVRTVREAGPAVAPFGLFCYRVDARRRLIGGAVSNAGNLRAWCLRELRLPDDPAVVERALARRRFPEHGLTVLPFWSAERAPTWEENQRGVIDGISLNTSALDLLQAITEASYFRIARIAELLAEDAAGPLELVVSGGIQHSRASLQRLANVLGAPLHPSGEPEATLRGAAVGTLEKLGLPVPTKDLRRPIQPDLRAAERYARERERQQGLEKRLR